MSDRYAKGLPAAALPLAVCAFLLGGCIMPPAPEPAGPTLDPEPVAATPAEPAPAPTAVPELPPTAVVNRNANVRTGPGTGNPVAYWLHAGDAVTVVGRNADGTWLQIEHRDRPGWIAASLTDGAAEGMAALPAESAPADPEPVAAQPTREPAPETVQPAPDPEPAAAPEPTPAPVAATPAERTTATVVGTVVNLRTGPGTAHGTDGQARAGDRLRITGRNADGSWLRVMHPVATGEHVWIHAPLTDLDAASLARLAVVENQAAAAAPPVAPASAAAAQSPQPSAPTVPAGCTRLHTVNPNEQRLQQITDWFGLDLAATAALNGLATDTPLTAGWQICLPDAAAVQPQPEPQPQPARASQAAASGQCQTPIGPQPCIHIPDFSERGNPNAPIGPIVESASPYVWHAPGTYDRDLPGLDYDFELVFTDISVMWDWTVRDFAGCYDALRVHMGEVPEEFGLQRMELRLADSFISEEGDVNWKEFHWRENDIYFSPQAAVAVPWLEWPNWDPAALPHPDLAVVQYGCYLQPDELAVCDIVPWWGNSHSIHVNAAAARAMANTVMYMSNNALANRYRSRLHERVLQADAYLFPLLDTRVGNPAGQGPCASLWRAG